MFNANNAIKQRLWSLAGVVRQFCFVNEQNIPISK